MEYCNSILLKIQTRDKGSRTVMYFNTYSYLSFNWIKEAFYPNKNKIVLTCIEQFFTLLALAIWIIDDGDIISNGLRIVTNSFTLNDVTFLASILTNKYNLKISIYKVKDKDQWVIYIHKSSLRKLALIIGLYLHSSMIYKLNEVTQLL